MARAMDISLEPSLEVDSKFGGREPDWLIEDQAEAKAGMMVYVEQMNARSYRDLLIEVDCSFIFLLDYFLVVSSGVVA